MRDRGTQVTLGTFVATFVYAILALGSIAHGRQGDFVPHVSIDHAGAFDSYSSLTSASGEPGSLVGT